MTYLLDTNVVSEWARPHPNPGVVRWLADVDEDRVYISVLTFGELRRGVDRLTPGRRRHRLDTWLSEELADRFVDRVLPVDQDVADVWGRLLAHSESAGRPVGAVDGLIAATAEHHGLEVVTRNVRDFETTGVRLLNPWSD